MTPAELAILKTEVTTDSLGRYAGMTHEQIADRLNVRDRQANRETLEAGDLIASIVGSEYATLTALQKDYVRLVAMAQTMPLTPTLKTQLGAMFPAGSVTRDNLLALLKRPGSRAEELGIGHVKTSDVADALRS